MLLQTCQMNLSRVIAQLLRVKKVDRFPTRRVALRPTCRSLGPHGRCYTTDTFRCEPFPFPHRSVRSIRVRMGRIPLPSIPVVLLGLTGVLRGEELFPLVDTIPLFVVGVPVVVT